MFCTISKTGSSASESQTLPSRLARVSSSESDKSVLDPTQCQCQLLPLLSSDPVFDDSGVFRLADRASAAPGCELADRGIMRKARSLRGAQVEEAVGRGSWAH